jgi:predicted ATPase/DNA-binding SARP family transcriptional activator
MASLTTGRLPVQLVPLVGRQRELQDAVDALSRSRLVTLTGPGGTGKTRLALAAADAARGTFADGVCWVELAPIDDPEVVALAVAGSLGAGEEPGRDVADTLAEHVGEHSMLIVLDNCEHLAAPAAELAHRLLGSCPALSILATSREALGVPGERQLAVPPLALPRDDIIPAPSAIAEFDAVQFFEQRAQLVLPSFRLADTNAAAVHHVCRRLDGLPLAIELAAARLRILSVGQLAERLDDIFAVLVGGVRTAPRRHQTLRATLDWSHDLLAEDERAVFRRLAVFAGGFTLAAAEEVTVGRDIRPGQVLDLLTRLADKSLLRVDHTGDDVRYQLLATVRDYARECLAAATEEEPTRRAHLLFFADFVEQIEPRISGTDDAHGPVDLERELNRIEAETSNLRAAVEFARASGDVRGALRIAGPLERYAYLRGQYSEVRHWMDSAVTIGPDAPAVLLAKALLGSGRLALLQCEYVPAIRRLEAALRLYRELDDAQGVARALQALGSVAREQGRYARSIELHEESLAIAEAAGDRWAAASAHGYLGFASWLQRDFERATAECTTALQESRKLGDVEGTAWSLISLGIIARYQGARERAAALLEESRSLSEKIGFREGIAWSLEQLGLLAIDRGDLDAEPLLRRSLEVHRDLRDQWRACSVLDDLAALALARGGPLQATRLLAAAEEMRGAIGTVVAPCEAAEHATILDGARAALGDDAFEAAWRQGQLIPVEDLLAELPGAGPPAADRAAGQAAPVAPAAPAAAAARAGTATPAAPAAAPGEPAPAADAAKTPVPAAEASPAQRRKAARPAAQRPRSAPEQEAGETEATDGVLRIRALGAATVHRGDTLLTAADWGYGKPRELLFLLATSPPMTREQLGVALWPDQARERLGNALHTALRELRRALGDPGWVLYVEGRYAFNGTRNHDCDVETFEQALADARRARPAAAALPDLQRAIAAYGGDFLADLAAGEWAQTRRDELRRAFESALLAAGRLHAAAGRHQPAVTAFRRAVAHEPLNETAHRELMTSWARLGETARAVQHYRELEQMLREQVGVPPAAETTALYRRLLAER